MHDRGLLGRIFPEFQPIFSRVVRDFYHKYTVDEHTLLTIRNLERLTHAVDAEPRPLRRAAGRSRRTRSCWCWRSSSTTSANGATTITRSKACGWRGRCSSGSSLPAESRAIVEFLIQNHLQMSLVAFRRDTEDPDIVRHFAELVGIEERLKMLCLLTLVDVEAVSLETLTPWREELLWRLYVDTYNHLTLSYGDERIERDQSKAWPSSLAGRPDDVSETEIRRFLEGLPCRYLQLFDRDVIYRHVQLSRDIKPDHVHAALERKGDAWELTVVTLDKPFLFSNICGVLSSFGMDILRGHAMTNPNGLVLDIFQFTDEERFLELNNDGQKRFLEVLEAAVSGRLDVAARLRAREHSVLQPRQGPALRARSSTPTIIRRSATRFWISSPATRSGCCTESAG